MESPLKKMKAEEEESIQVFVRIRPLNSQEKTKHSYSILDSPGTREIIVKERSGSNVTKTFTFDRAFGPQSKQIEVYRAVVAPLLSQVMQGYNCTVFAYGQTGTGKTFTMEGERSQESLNWSEDPMAGIVPRALGQLFDELRQQSSEFTIRVSLLELYNEELYDLLAPVEGQKLRNLRMYEDPSKKNSITIQGLEEVIVRSKHEVYQIMEKGSERRKTAATLMNAHSSRSHTVLTVTVHIKESTMEGEDLLKVGKLNLVDLAGSENIGRSGAVDKRAREAGNINQSLLTLGRVITALVERAPHVPYRESKLTRILKDSLGGNTKTSIIATVSPANINVEETLSTLEYAHRAKNIYNQPTVNQRLTKHVMISHYTEEIERLRRDLAASREKNGVYVDKANYEETEAKLLSLQQELNNNATHTKNLVTDLENCQADLQVKEAEADELKAEVSMLKAVLNETKDTLKVTQKKLKQTEEAKEEQEHLVSKHVLTESKIKNEASTLLNTADDATMSLERLYSKLERKRTIEQTNLEAGKRMKKEISDQLEDIRKGIDGFRSDHASFCGEQRLRLEEFLSEKEKMLKLWNAEISVVYDSIKQACSESMQLVTDQCKVVQDENKQSEAEISKKCADCLTTVNAVIDKLVNVHQVIDEKMEAIDSKIGSMTQNFKNQLDVQQDRINNYVLTHLEEIVFYKNQLKSISETYTESNANVLSQIVSQKEKSEKQAEDLQKKLAAVLKNVDSIMKESKSYQKESSCKYDGLLKDITAVEESMKDGITSLDEEMARDEANAKALGQDTESGFKNLISLTDIQKQELSQTAQNVKLLNHNSSETLKEQKEIQKEEMNGITSALSERSSVLENRIAEFGTQFTSVHDQLGSSTSLLSNKNQKFSTALGNLDIAQVTNTKQALEDHCHQADEWSEDQRSKVYQQAGIVHEFWDSTYLVDNPTGATPRKQTYSYPKTISATSPHERIISRFRANRRIYDDDEDRENF